MTNTAFDNLRDQLRQAGCTLACQSQHELAPDHFIEQWLVQDNHGRLIPIVVIDRRRKGYSLYIESNSIKINDDVAAILDAARKGNAS
ncbi:hypothetical protein [Alterisphingorhabdus coralli]|uniref:Uncharacterized protein n=1 Tax=Alterisphingorhabdus coralli TaxID=3071408 RepID=A0AA97FBQ9_9SPHN|nr:hypothetical protein [Parasphingorhabdus sp. SCSIO 66989]WOE76722.1 hypothetical protein RB602_15160 [Parasphingorhabdus sp. SCSIO 66989]